MNLKAEHKIIAFNCFENGLRWTKPKKCMRVHLKHTKNNKKVDFHRIFSQEFIYP